MKKIINIVFAVSAIISFSCNEPGAKSEETAGLSQAVIDGGGQASVKDDESAKDVVKIAAGSKDHTTLVAAIKQADLVNSLSNAGPFTVFAPTNAAFDKVGKETLDNLMKNETKEKLQDILQYHVYVGSLKTEMMTDGQTLNQVNGGNITIAVKDGKLMINNTATVITSIPAANGIIHVIDAVLLPPSK
ncbi:fasciclin domain-containing protein [Terrimonas pollutisoli]|uniref:fasciclin domain-containing protein n=1 Tax=Terrimonas pollutisoli TaxID=3034147 RepID=UPI0023EAD9FF|nr:fasciclin domain-containing protein [Terrimonas sp. H1YJ31]